jgi:hypothetical protein
MPPRLRTLTPKAVLAHKKRKKSETHEISEDEEGPCPSQHYWLLRELPVAQAFLEKWVEEGEVGVGVFYLISHASDSEDTSAGKIMMGCALCRDHYKNKKPPNIQDRTWAWANGVGCHGRKLEALKSHVSAAMHAVAVVKQVAVGQKADIKACISDANAAKREVMEKLFRIIFHIATTNRPLSDYVPLRNLHVRNGVEEMDLEPSNGKGLLSQPTANYTSEEFIGEALECLAAICRQNLGHLIRADETFLLALLADASQDVAVHEVLLLYLRWLRNGEPQETFLGAVRLGLPSEPDLETFALALQPPVHLKKSTPSRQGDYRMKGGVNQCRVITQYLDSKRCKQVFPGGFPFPALRHLGLDGVSSNMSERVGLASCLQRYQTQVPFVPRPVPLQVQHCTGHQWDLTVHAAWNAVPYLVDTMDPALTECWLWVSQSAVRSTKLKEVAEALDVTGTIKKAAGRWLSRDKSIERLRTSRPALVAELKHDARESEQKARAQGIQTIITSFMFVCTLYFLSDVMPALTVFCKTLQKVDLSLEGVLAAYQMTRATLQGFKVNLNSMPFLRRFVVALSAGNIADVVLPRRADHVDHRACVGDHLSKWDKAVRGPFLGHLTQLLFEMFNKTEPTLRAMLLLVTPV